MVSPYTRRAARLGAYFPHFRELLQRSVLTIHF